MSSRRLARTRTAAALLGLAALVGCGPQDVTAPRLDRSVATTFANLYAYQQTVLGLPGEQARNVTASCGKAGGGAQVGAGDGWTCTVLLVDPAGAVHNVPYDLSVQADACWHANGPPGVVGAARELAADGRTVVNPLFAFDGCFDPT